MNFSDGEVNSLCELVLVVDLDPSFNKLCWKRHDVIRNIELSKRFLFENNIVLCSFWWLTKLISVRSLGIHFSKLLLGRFEIHFGHANIINHISSEITLLWHLESLLSSDFDDGFNYSQALK
jgi:hypothetical protein